MSCFTHRNNIFATKNTISPRMHALNNERFILLKHFFEEFKWGEEMACFSTHICRLFPKQFINHLVVSKLIFPEVGTVLSYR